MSVFLIVQPGSSAVCVVALIVRPMVGFLHPLGIIPRVLKANHEALPCTNGLASQEQREVGAGIEKEVWVDCYSDPLGWNEGTARKEMKPVGGDPRTLALMSHPPPPDVCKLPTLPVRFPQRALSMQYAKQERKVRGLTTSFLKRTREPVSFSTLL
jgi:hypothetical protein